MPIWPWVICNFVYHIYVFLKIYFICLHPYWGFHLTIKFLPNLVVFKNGNCSRSLGPVQEVHAYDKGMNSIGLGVAHVNVQEA
jgi:hypothetical protein